MDLYAENILDHYRHPRGKVALASPTVTHAETNASCGDTLTLSLHIEGGVVTEVGWEGSGCAISQAAMSMLSEEILGKRIQELEGLRTEDIQTMLGVPIGPRRFKCAFLCLEALQHALQKL